MTPAVSSCINIYKSDDGGGKRAYVMSGIKFTVYFFLLCLSIRYTPSYMREGKEKKSFAPMAYATWGVNLFF